MVETPLQRQRSTAPEARASAERRRCSGRRPGRRGRAITHASIAAAVSVALMATGAGSSNAAADATPFRIGVPDGTGDGWYYENDGPFHVEADPTPTTIDVTRTVVSHRRHAVSVSLRVTDLRRVGTQELNLSLRAPTPRADGGLSIEGRSEPGNRGGRLRIESDDGAVICPHALIRWAYAEDVVTVRTSRSCLGRPAWVQVYGSTSLWFDPDPALFVDDALSDQAWSDASTPRAYAPPR